MKERPIIFNAHDVRAIIEGRKTQTRRIVKSQPPHHPEGRWSFVAGSTDAKERGMCRYAWPDPQGRSYTERGRETGVIVRPPCATGDRLWVRETWMHSNWPDGPAEQDCAVFYRADYLDDPLGPDLEHSPDSIRRKWLPSIHMPRWASRILLEVTAVLVERLQDISDEDALAEGLKTLSKDGGRTFKTGLPDRDGLPDGDGWPWRAWEEDPRRAYKRLWESIYGSDSWAQNPWVWVIEFRRIEP